MENTTQEKIVDPSTGIKDYKQNRIDLQDAEYMGKARYFEVKNWRTVEEQVKDKVFIKWKASVVKYGESIMLLNIILGDQPKEIVETATGFRIKVNKLLEGKNPQQSVMLRVKYSGKKDGKHDFDVELG